MILTATVRALAVVAVLLIGTSLAYGERREITFDVPGGVVGDLPRNLAFAHNGRVGFTLAFTQDPNSLRFNPSFFVSFSVTEGKAVDRVDLAPDFGVGNSSSTIPVVSFKVDDATGLVLIYGNDTNNEQKIVALVSDERGRLTRRWSASFGRSSVFRIFWQDVAFNADASRVYFLHYEASTNVTLLRADDGTRLSNSALPAPAALGFVHFDVVRGRLVALSGFTAYTFRQQNDELTVESQTEFVSDSSIPPFAQGISRDGRFLVAYGAFTHVTNKIGFNTYQTYDLDMGTAREFEVPGRLYAAANGPTFHRATGRLLVPLLGAIKIINQPLAAERSFRQVDILGLSEDGTISRIVEFRLPERSAGNSRLNVLDSSNNIEASATGALAFVGVSSGQLFTFDAASGEIVGDERVDPDRVLSMRLLEPLGKVVFTNGTNAVVIIDVATGPAVGNVKVGKKTTTIKGANFLSGARVKVNGTDLGVATRNPDDPGHEIILPLGKNDFPRGESFTVEVINRDGLASKPFAFTR